MGSSNDERARRVRYLHPDFIKHVLPNLPDPRHTYVKDEDKDANMNRMTASKIQSLQKYWPHLLEAVTTEDVRIPGRERALITVRIYRPKQGTHNAEKSPVVVNYHGGGFVAGSIDTDELIARQLCAAADTIVFSVDYRLVPDIQLFPTLINDCEDALKWVYENAPGYGGDTSMGVFLSGTSSGGLIVMSLGYRTTTLRVPIRGVIVRQPGFIVSEYSDLEGIVPPEYLGRLRSIEENWEAPMLSGEKLKQLIQRMGVDPKIHLNQDYFPIFAPLETLVRMPPTYFVLAECDPVVDEVILMKDRLIEAGARVRYMQYPGMPHGFHAHHVLKSARDEMKDTADALLDMIDRSR